MRRMVLLLQSLYLKLQLMHIMLMSEPLRLKLDFLLLLSLGSGLL